MKIFSEFKEFLNEYKVIGLAVAFVIGVAATALVKSIVDNIIMPLITPWIPGGAWETATLTIGRVVIGWGPFLSALINFLIIAVVVFFIAKFMVGAEKK
ncbi:MAG: MscL family protein [Nanoarchaeota archaeon]|nr:MscL family protein [Nanoarchaeota archaeon]